MTTEKSSVFKFGFTLILLILCGVCARAFAEEARSGGEEDFFDMSIEELMDVEVITVSRSEDALFRTPAAITVLTSEDIRRSGHQSIPELLRMVPGVHVARIDSNKWAITARGFNGLYAEKLLVLIDGRTVYTPLYSGVYWDVQDVMLEDIERIEVVKGPGGTLWGANAVNGIINIITRKAADTQGTLVSGGMGTEEKGFSSFRHGGKLGENAYYRVYAKYFNRDEAIYSDRSPAADSTDALREGFRIDWDKSERDHFTLQGDFYKGHSGLRTRMTSPGVNYQTDDNSDVRGWNILTRWTRKYSDTSDMSLQFYYDRTERYAVNLGESRDTFDIDFQHRFQLLDGHNLIWGLGYRHTGDNTDNTYTVAFNPSNRNEELFSGFVQDEITIVDDLLKLIVGTKVEKNDYTGYEFQPSARLLWTPDERNTLWASFTRAVSTPSRAYTHMTNKFNSIPPMQFIGSSNLKSQEVKSYEVGYRVKPKDNLFFDFSLFYNEYDHLYAQENNPTAFSTIFDNKMYGETYGTEIAAHWQVNESWKLAGGYSFLKMQMHTENSSTNTTIASRTERESPCNMFHLNSQLNLQDNLEFNTTLYYVDSVPHWDTPSYTRLDMGLTWHIRKNMDFSIIGQNLLDRSHPESGEDGVIATEIQRAVLARVTWEF
ncbi:MAG: TonB-dependent receptor [Planctomycetota bacterium]|nr:MAG: TonB-dependent receptor [Planctomycetota bacterium]